MRILLNRMTSTEDDDDDADNDAPVQRADFHRFILPELAVALATSPIRYDELAFAFAQHWRCETTDAELLRVCEAHLADDARLLSLVRAELCAGLELCVQTLAVDAPRLRCAALPLSLPQPRASPVDFARAAREAAGDLFDDRRRAMLAANRALLRRSGEAPRRRRPVAYPSALDVTKYRAVLGVVDAHAQTTCTSACPRRAFSVPLVCAPPRQLCVARYATQPVASHDAPLLMYIPPLPNDDAIRDFTHWHSAEPARALGRSPFDALREEELLEEALQLALRTYGASDRIVNALASAFDLRAAALRRLVADTAAARHRLERYSVAGAPQGLAQSREPDVLVRTFARLFCAQCGRFACTLHEVAPRRYAGCALSASTDAALCAYVASGVPECEIGLARLACRITHDADKAAKLVGGNAVVVRSVWAAATDWQTAEAAERDALAVDESRRQLRKRLKPTFGSETVREEWRPCEHEGSCVGNAAATCSCVAANVACEDDCACAPRSACRFPGCGCGARERPCSDVGCLCLLAMRECDPEVCECAWPCANANCQRQARPADVQARPSRVQGAGWGLFATRDIAKDAFVGEYVGESVSHEEAERRGFAYDAVGVSYIFAVTPERDVDAARVGNETRFINHSDDAAVINCTTRALAVNGAYRLGVYASKPIKQGDELFYDYAYRSAEHLKLVAKDGAAPALAADAHV